MGAGVVEDFFEGGGWNGGRDRGRMQTDGSKQICPFNAFEVGGIMRKL